MRRFGLIGVLGKVLAGVVLFSGCASTPDGAGIDSEESAEVLSEHDGDAWGPVEEFSSYPRLEVQTKVSDRRVVSGPIVQSDGSSFSAFGSDVIGFPASLRIVNKDAVAAEIIELNVWRRPVGRFGSYDSFIGANPIVLQAGESWEGTFIVSRKDGWYRLRARPAAPEGWEAVHGSDLRNVFFQYGEDESGRLRFVFWNLSEEEATFRYWVADGIPDGIPEDFTASGTVTLPPGGRESAVAEKPGGDWALVSKRVVSPE